MGNQHKDDFVRLGDEDFFRRGFQQRRPPMTNGLTGGIHKTRRIGNWRTQRRGAVILFQITDEAGWWGLCVGRREVGLRLVVEELRDVVAEDELEIADWTVALLRNDDLGDELIAECYPPEHTGSIMTTAVPLTVTLKTRVLVTMDDRNLWFARGLDIDFAAQGQSWLEVQKAFEIGFVRTMKEHLEAYGTLQHFLRPAPEHVFEQWSDVARQTSSSETFLRLKQVSDYDLVEIEYFEVAA